MTSADRIEKHILLRAPVARVWRALTDSAEFGKWFGVRFEGPFVPGAAVKGVIVTTSVDPEVAKAQKPYAGMKFEFVIDRMERESLFSFRWHPAAVDRGVDYSAEPTTVVVFTLEQVPEGVLLRVTESGFDQVPPARRASAFAQNEQGWGMVVKLIEKYLENAPKHHT